MLGINGATIFVWTIVLPILTVLYLHVRGLEQRMRDEESQATYDESEEESEGE